MKSFVHLHVHSYYSMLDGMSSISGLIDKAQADGMPAIALTDHGSMFGIKEFYDYAKKKNNGIKKTISEKEIALTTATDEAEKTKLQQEIAKLQKSHIKPILGSEVYVAKRTRFDKSEDIDRSGSHLVILAKNKQGYKNLCKIVSYGYIEGFYYRPRIDKDLLEKYSEGLIVTSACLGGEIHRLVGRGDIEGAEKSILWFKKIFGDDYYLELQRHKTDKPGADTHVFEKQERQNEVLIALARKTNTKLIASNDVHFVEEEHAEAHDRLICLSTGKDLEDEKRMRYSKQEWLKTSAQMNAIFADIPEAIENTIELANKVEYYSIESNPIMPAFSIPSEFGSEAAYREKYTHEDLKKEFTYDEHGNKVLSDKEANEKIEKLGGVDGLYRVKLEADYLRKITFEGTANRYGEELSPDIRERIEFELHIMKTMGFPGYFLIVQDLIQAARDMGVSVGPGRGSAAGSVVAYCLKITDIDPLKYDLLFERFLNPDRISMPDIDIDFDDDGRGKVLEYVTEKYGKEHVAQIATYGTMATKMAIKDVARVQKLPLSESDRLTKLIPNSFPEEKGKSPKVNITNCIERIPELKEARYSTDSRLSDTLKYAEMLEGTVRQVGIHACGVIIGADDLTNFVPLCTDKNNPETLVTQYEGSSIETIGLIKMDFLGLKTLSIINETLRNIKASKGITVEIESIPIDDAKTYELYSKGLTTGTFQFESAGMQKYLRDLKPNRFEDLIAMNALYRPGPMAYIPSFVNRKHGIEEIEYDFPIMKDRLHDTYGITVYQEQVMLLSRDLAGFTRGESDELRKAMGKKLIDKMDALKEKFLAGGMKNGHGKKTLEKIWADWEKFASYAFNKSHATCYSWVAYQTAWLKANYPSEYMAAVLSRNLSNITEITKFMDECKAMNMNVLGPDVNESYLKFSVNQAGDIRFGLAAVKGVGEGAVMNIIEERRRNGAFRSIFDFVERVNLSSCNKKNIESLALAGAFDAFNEIKREQFFGINAKGEAFIDQLIRYGNKYQLDKNQAANSLFGDDTSFDIAHPEIPKVERWSDLERLNKERELIGIYLSAHPLDEYKIALNYGCNVGLSEIEDKDALKNREISFGGLVSNVREGITKNGKPFMIIRIEDFTGSGEVPLFGDDYINFGKYGRLGLYLFIKGRVQGRRFDTNQMELKIQSIQLLPDVKDNLIEKLTITLPLHDMNTQMIEELSTLTKNNPGNSLLYFEIVDGEKNMKVELFSRNTKISVKKELIDYLTENESLIFKVN